MSKVYKFSKSNLVYHYLIEIGCPLTAKLLTKKRRRTGHGFDLKNGMTFARFISRLAAKYNNRKLVNSVFINHFKSQQNQAFQDLAAQLEFELKTRNAPFSLTVDIPSMEEFFNTVFVNFLRNHQKPGIRKLGEKLIRKLQKRNYHFGLKDRFQ